MTDELIRDVEQSVPANGWAVAGDGQASPWHARTDQLLPRLNLPGAWPISRDRCEHVVTGHIVPGGRDHVWRALTEPDQIRYWFAASTGSLGQSQTECLLDFGDGEFFLCRPFSVRPPEQLQYVWRWLGIGPATAVTWRLDQQADVTRVTVTEEARNPPRDWQTWHGEGWPGILGQLASYLRTGTEWRWPWRRMGPYAVVELPVAVYEAWDRLFGPAGLKYWLLSSQGSLTPGVALKLMMGDASGMVEFVVREVVNPGEAAPSFLPHVSFSLNRHAWNGEVGGRVWLEPGALGSTLLQVFLYGWENLRPELQLTERRIFASFWADAARRAVWMCGGAHGSPSTSSTEVTNASTVA